MATNPDDPGVAPDPTTDGQRDPNAAPDPQTTDPTVTDDGDPPEPLTVEALAQDMGWMPKEQFKGPEDKWKPAADFIREGREIQRGYASELKSLRSTVDTISKTSAQILEDRLEEQRSKLVEQFNAQVEEGNATEAFKIGEKLRGLDAKPIQQGPPPEVHDFVTRHSNWFNVDPAATMRAREVSDRLAATGASVADQLAAAERVVRAEYPDLFKGQANGQQRQAPYVATPGSRGSAPSNRAKGFSDMPKQAQDIARDMVDRGLYPKVDDYVKYYWQNAEGKR